MNADLDPIVDALATIPATLPAIGAMLLVIWRERPRHHRLVDGPPQTATMGSKHCARRDPDRWQQSPDVATQRYELGEHTHRASEPWAAVPPQAPNHQLSGVEGPRSVRSPDVDHSPRRPFAASEIEDPPKRGTATAARSDHKLRNPRWYQTLRHLPARRRATVSAEDAARWCDGIARELRAGATTMTAIVRAERPASVDRCAGEVLFSIERGRHLLEGLALLAPTPKENPHLALVMTVLLSVGGHGGPAAEPIDRAAATLRARAADEAERSAQSAQARMSALVMTLLPIVMLGVMGATSPSVRGTLLTPLGAAVVAVGACFNGVGWIWMRHIINGGAT